MPDDIRPLLDEVSAARLESHLDFFADVRRDTGGPGEDKAVDHIVETLRQDGVPVRVHEFDAYLSYPRRASLEMADEAEPESFVCLTHSFATSTGPRGRVAEVVYVPEGDDLRHASGRIALIDGLSSPIKILQASQAGCAGVIFANAEWFIHNMIGTTIWGGAPTPELTDRLPSVPVVSVNHEAGEAIKARLAKGPVRVKLTTEVDTGWYRSRLPEAIVTPADPIDDAFVLTGGHYCSWEYGITDNSTGVADILELARVFQTHRDKIRRELRFAWWPGHSHGRYAGSTFYADTYFEELSDRCIAYHNIDSPGVRGASTYIVRHTTADMEDAGRRIIETYTSQRNPEAHRPNRSADQSFLANGIPSVSLYSFLPKDHPDRKAWTGGCAGAWWWHTEHDTRDKADTEVLVTDARASIGLLHELSNARALPIRPSRTAAELLEVLDDITESAGGRLVVDHLQDRGRTLRASLERLEQRGAEVTDPEERQEINRALLATSRQLNTLMYASRDRFTHDPADMTPIMRARGAMMAPGLGKAAALPGLQDDEDGRGFLLTLLRRQVNRFNETLKTAQALADLRP